jgi:ABC-type nickel/cobalt efflux system permease component RcnA
LNTSIAYGSTLILGALHALEPGHGKSFIAAYLIGEKLSLRQIITLSVSLLVSHFLLLIIIALLMRFIFSSAAMEGLHEGLSWAGPLMILAFGFYLLLNHRHSHEEHDVFHHHAGETNKGSIRRSAVVGVISGLIPCPTVVAPVLMSGAVNNFHNAIFYIMTYVLGMGLVMTVVMLLFFFLRETLLKKLDAFASRIHPHLFSAVLIITVGIVYLLLRIFAHSHHA